VFDSNLFRDDHVTAAKSSFEKVQKAKRIFICICSSARPPLPDALLSGCRFAETFSCQVEEKAPLS
jgi:tRNA A37 threonylcarbamoyltransferase TsaD